MRKLINWGPWIDKQFDEIDDDEIASVVSEALLVEFPPLTRIQKERQEIVKKRAAFSDDLAMVRAERERLRADIIDLDADEADILRILAGLDKNEEEIRVAGLKAQEAEITDKPAPQKRRGKEAVAA